MPSTRGPTPKRDAERAGHRTKDESADSVRMRGAVRKPPADKAWSEGARRMYESLARSGQSRYFEPSDWAFAQMTADLHTANEAKQSAQAWQLIFQSWERLGATENMRRRMRVEVERVDAAEPEDADLEAMLDELKSG